jgi:hypothetical protein
MAIRNSANYKIGNTYIFKVERLGFKEHPYAVIAKADRQMLLKNQQGNSEWYKWADITFVENKKEKVQSLLTNPQRLYPSQIKAVAKTVTKLPCSEEPKHKDVVPMKPKNYELLAKNYGRHLKALRLILFNKGYGNVYELNPSELRDLIKEIVPEKLDKEFKKLV